MFIYFILTNTVNENMIDMQNILIDKYIIKNINNEGNLYLFQTYYDKNKIPNDVYNNIQQYAPEYNHVVLDDNELLDFMNAYFNKSVVDTFNNLKRGAHKADLARYCLLYVYGGLYLDVKTELVLPLKDIFVNKNTIYSVISYQKDHVYQGIIHTPPQQVFFLKLIDYIVSVQNPQQYHDICRDFYRKIMDDVGQVNYGFLNGKNNSYYLFEEKCSNTDDGMCYDGLDKYGFCCFVWDNGKPIIKTRRANYPF
jgi:hypothetical protein